MTKPHDLRGLPDADLLVQLKTLVGRSNQLTASVLAHLAEVEARGIYRDLACSSLYAYCVYELRMSEDEAQRRIIAARAVRRFPVLIELLETAAIHLTGIVLLAPHLTEENHERLLASARYRSKREIQKLIATVAPRPDVPARVEPLAPQPRPGRATWAAFLESLSGGVRDLPCGTGPGEAPWAGPLDPIGPSGPAGGSPAPARVDGDGGMGCPAGRDVRGSAGGSPAPAQVHGDGPADESPAPAQVDGGDAAPELRYKVQFTASEHYVRLLEEARNLLQHEVPDRDIARVHELAMEALVAKLRKRRGAPAAHPNELRGEPEEIVDTTSGTEAPAAHPNELRGEPEEIVDTASGAGAAPARRQPEAAVDATEDATSATAEEATSAARQSGGCTRSRYVPAALYCRAHNQLMAERELGRDYVQARIEARRSGRSPSDSMSARRAGP